MSLLKSRPKCGPTHKSRPKCGPTHKSRPKCGPNHCCQNSCYSYILRIRATSVHFQQLPKANNHPIGEQIAQFGHPGGDKEEEKTRNNFSFIFLFSYFRLSCHTIQKPVTSQVQEPILYTTAPFTTTTLSS
jgi:hypothetical protein